MPKKTLFSFGSGEVTPRLLGRVDFDRYFNACQSLVNYFLYVTGDIEFRAGTQLVDKVDPQSSRSRLIAFVFNVDIAYVLEFSDFVIRLYRDGASLNYDIVSPYSDVDLNSIKYAQSADVMYLVDGIGPPQKLIRLGDTDWTISEPEFKNGPFLTANLDESLSLNPSYPSWVDATAYKKNDIVNVASTAINPPSYSTQNIDNAAAVNVGGGLVDIPVTGHGYSVGMAVEIEFSVSYDGNFIVQAGTTSNFIRISSVFTAEFFAGTETVRRKAIPVDKGAGLVGIPTNPNSIAINSFVILSGFVGYNATYTVHNSSTTDEIVIEAPYVAEYFTGSEVVTESIFYKSLTDHTSGGGNPTPPGNTTDWTKALTFSGSNLVINSSKAFFDIGHVGALFKLVHPRIDSGIQGSFTAIGVSEWIRVSKGTDWSFITSSVWGGVVELQRSYNDGASHEIVKIYRSEGAANARNVSVTGTELEDNALYRVALTQYFIGTISYDFNVDDFETEGIVKITEFVSDVQVKAEVKTALGNVIATVDWCEGAWSKFRGFPRAITFYDNMLVFAGSDHLDTTIWTSNRNDFEDFQTGTLANQSIVRRLDGDLINRIEWLASGEDLIIGTSGGIWRMGASDRREIMSPVNVTHRRQNNLGSSSAQGIEVNNSFLYVSRNGNKINELIYDSASEGYVAGDLNRISEHLTADTSIVEIIYSEKPEQVIYCRLDNGKVLLCFYRREEKFVAWSRFETAGKILSMTVVPMGREDEVWFIADRSNGVSQACIERKKFQSIDSVTDNMYWFLDSALDFNGLKGIEIVDISRSFPCEVFTDINHGLSSNDKIRISGVNGMVEVNGTYQINVSSPKSFELFHHESGAMISSISFSEYTDSGEVEVVIKTITNLNHLEGQIVSCIVDGRIEENKMVQSGVINLDGYGNKIIAGLPYSGTVRTMPVDFQGGPLLGQLSRISRASFVVRKTGALYVWNQQGFFEEINFYDQDIVMDEPQSLFHGNIVYNFDEGFRYSVSIELSQRKPLPQNILAIAVEVEMGEYN